MERSKKGRQLLWYITLNKLMMRWFFALMLLFSAIIVALVSFEFIPTEFFDQLFFSWLFVGFYYFLVYLTYKHEGFYLIRSIRFSRVIRLRLYEKIRNDVKIQMEKIKIEKNLAVRKSFGLIGKNGAIVLIRIPDDLRSAELLEPQLDKLADYLSVDYGFSASSWDRWVLNHHEYRVMRFTR